MSSRVRQSGRRIPMKTAVSAGHRKVATCWVDTSRGVRTTVAFSPSATASSISISPSMAVLGICTVAPLGRVNRLGRRRSATSASDAGPGLRVAS